MESPSSSPTTVADAPKRRGLFGLVLWLFFVALLAGGGFYGYQLWAKQDLQARTERAQVEETLASFDEAIEKRHWDKAADLIAVLEEKGGSTAEIEGALARIEQGKVEERGQQIAFLVSNAQSTLEAGQLSEAESFCAQVEELQPDHPQLPDLRAEIKESRRKIQSRLMVMEIERALGEKNWRVAENQIASLVRSQPEHTAISRLRTKLDEIKKQAMINRAKAAELIAQARELDKGVYSPEAIALLEEAVRLDPSEEVKAVYKRYSEYGKVIRVPAEFPTIAAALNSAKANDRIFVEKGTYRESLVIPPGVEVVGEDRATTIIECLAEQGAVVTVGEGSKRVRIASLTLRHLGLVNEDERFPVVAINHGYMQIEDVFITHASGHGVAVLNGGKAGLALCKISESGWDGVSVKGEDATAVLSKVISQGNLHHGVDFWDGASGQITQSQFLDNGRAGVAAIETRSAITINESLSEGNREIGFFFSGIAGVSLINCDVHKNLLGGIVFERSSKAIRLENNRVTHNGKAGIVFEKGVEILERGVNKVEENEGHQIWDDAVFSPRTDEETITPPPPAPPEVGTDEGNAGPASGEESEDETEPK